MSAYKICRRRRGRADGLSVPPELGGGDLGSRRFRTYLSVVLVGVGEALAGGERVRRGAVGDAKVDGDGGVRGKGTGRRLGSGRIAEGERERGSGDGGTREEG